MNLKRRRTTRDDKADQLIEYLATNYVSGTLVADHDLMSALGWSRSTVGAARHRAVEQGRLRFQGLTGAGGGVGYELIPPVDESVAAALEHLDSDVAAIVAVERLA